MDVVVVIGAGMMGTAMCWPLSDRVFKIRLVGSPLDHEIIDNIRKNRVHPKLERRVPDGVEAYFCEEMAAALQGADLLVIGVSSFGIPWFIEEVIPLLSAELRVIAVTKGLVDLDNGDLQTIPHFIAQSSSGSLGGKLSVNAIGGPCIAHELAARRQTSVVFCGTDEAALRVLQENIRTSYYHIWTSSDVVGVEVCAAMKNAYALAVGMVIGLMEKAGPDGQAHMFNPQATVFAQSCFEMRRFLQITGGGLEQMDWLPGPGDLFVTVFGGRTVRMGRLLGLGLSYPEAREQMAGETLESVEITRRVGRALPKLAARGIVKPEEFPLMKHLYAVIEQGAPVEFPWDLFFQGNPRSFGL